MNPCRVLSVADLHAALSERGFTPTPTRSRTGVFWRYSPSHQHIQVPDSLEGFYPDWMLYDLMSRISEIIPSFDNFAKELGFYSRPRH